MQQWKQSVEEKLASLTQAVTPAQTSEPGPCVSSPPRPAGTTNPRSIDVSFPDSGFQSTCGQRASADDSFLSSGTTDSLKTVRALSPAPSDSAVDSEDCSLLEKYLSSVQQREEEEEEEVVSDRTETPQQSSPASPSQSTPTNSPAQRPPPQIR